jgi:hypothetical protein
MTAGGNFSTELVLLLISLVVGEEVGDSKSCSERKSGLKSATFVLSI